MSPDLVERVDAYLEGRLSLEETRAVEALLVDPEVAAVLAEQLAIRALLSELPGDAAPADLADRVIEALGMEAAAPIQERRPASSSGAMIGGLRLALTGPGSPRGGRAALSGLSTLRYALGPLASERAPKPPLWRRALGLGRSR